MANASRVEKTRTDDKGRRIRSVPMEPAEFEKLDKFLKARGLRQSWALNRIFEIFNSYSDDEKADILNGKMSLADERHRRPLK